MKQLHNRTAEEAFQFHTTTPVRVYERDEYHEERVRLSRRVLGAGLAEYFQKGKSHACARIIELGCGTGDIGGFFSWGHNVKGYEASSQVAIECAKRWSWMDVKVADVQVLEPHAADVLIATEILEHVVNPGELLKRWLPKVEYALISSPVKGDVPDELSGNQHVWSFDPGDLERMVFEAGHTILHAETVPMGGYTDHILFTKKSE